MTKKKGATKMAQQTTETAQETTKMARATASPTLFAIQEIDIQIVEYLTRHPEHIDFTVINKAHEKLGIPSGTLRHHLNKLKKYGILKAALYLSEDTKELMDKVKRIGERNEEKEQSP